MGDLNGAFAVDRKLENPPHNGSGFLIDQPMVLLVRVFSVPVNFMVRRGNPRPGAGLIRGFLLPAEITKIKLVHDIQDRGKLATILIGAVNAVADSDETDAMLPEEYFGVISGLQVIASDPAHVFRQHSRDLSRFNVRDQPFPGGPFKVSAAPAIVRIMDAIQKAMLCGIQFQVFFLVGDGIAVPGEVVITRKALVKRGSFIFRLPAVHVGTPFRLDGSSVACSLYHFPSLLGSCFSHFPSVNPSRSGSAAVPFPACFPSRPHGNGF